VLKQIRELYRLLTADQRRRLLRLQILVVLMSFAEIAGVVSIAPFMALVGDMSQLQGEGRLARLYEASGVESPRQFLFWLGGGVLLVLTVSACICAFTTWRLSLYGSRVGAELSIRLYRHYLHQPWLFHASGTSSQLTNQIAQECQRTTINIINPLMQMNAKVVMAALMVLVILLLNPLVALVGLLVFGAAYSLLFGLVRRRLAANGRIITQSQRQRFKLLGEGFGGVKDVLLLGRQRDFIARFTVVSRHFAEAMGINLAMSRVPRFAMELVAFGGVISLVLYLLAAHEGNLGTILPVLSIYALAGFKLLPAFQQIYMSLAQVRGNLAAFEALQDDLRASAETDPGLDPEDLPEETRAHLAPEYSIELADVTFTYPGKVDPALRDVTVHIPVNRVIGLVGASGSGKSTLIDILLGLIRPQQGQLRVDGVPLAEDRLRAWQNSLGFVPQAIFLADSSIRENIAFGLPPETIDEDRVRRAATMAHLDELLDELPLGLETRVGERGVQLSGGQRQRIGIARALYDDADVLILDEATSALDGITERLIMDAIHDFAGRKTIIMIAHRLATVQQCDCIYLLANGQVVDQGSYDELHQRNAVFQRIAQHA
jgi:HlyD family secretion protein